VAVTAQRRPQAVGNRRRLLRHQPGQVTRHGTTRGLGHHLGGRVADALQRLQRARLYPELELARGQGGKHGGRAAEGLHTVRGRAAPFQLERDLPQRLERIHVRTPTHARPVAIAGEPAVHLHRFST
jgi:hypothetical protein